jgi:hypothetical protein
MRGLGLARVVVVSLVVASFGGCDDGGGASGGDSTGGTGENQTDSSASDSDSGNASDTGTGPGLECAHSYELGDGRSICCGAHQPGDTPPIPGLFEVELALTINGAPIVRSASADGYVSLQAQGGGDVALLGSTRDEALKTRVFAGTYDVIYEANARGGALPVNARGVACTGMKVAAETVSCEEDGEACVVRLECDMEVVEVAGRVRFDGAPPLPTPVDSGDLWVVDADGATTRLLATHSLSDGNFSARLLKGSYALHYGLKIGGVKLPRNTDAILSPMVAVAAGSSMSGFDVDLPLRSISGAIMVDGEAAPVSAYERAYIYLRDRETGALAKIGDTGLGPLDGARIIDAPQVRYDLVYAHALGVGELPRNQWATLSGPEGLSGAEVQAQVGSLLSITTATVSAAVTVDGAAPTLTPSNDLELVLEGASGGLRDRVPLGLLSEDAPRRLIPGGSFFGIYRHVVSDGGLPVNRQRQLAAQTIAGGEVVEVALTTSVLSGTITVNGAPATASAYDLGRVYLRGEGGDVVTLGDTFAGAFSRRVVDGDYTIHYAVERGGAAVPGNGDARIRSITVSGDEAIEIDVPAVDFVATNPLQLTESAYDRGELLLRPADGGDEIRIGSTADASLAARVIPGVYAVVYRLASRVAQAPANQGAVLSCVDLTLE